MQPGTLDIVKAGQIIYIEDAKGNSWPFGINNVLNRELVACQALGKKSISIQPDAENTLTMILPQEHGAYLVKAEVVEFDTERTRITLRPSDEANFLQRRQYFRVSKPSAIASCQIPGTNEQATDSIPIEGLVWDLSGNGIGMLIRATRTPYTGSQIRLTITLPGDSQMELLGEITRVVPKSIIKNEYLLGIYFTKIRESDRDKIIKFVIQEQVSHKNMKKK
jgi:c-di-GMP-binding flagellar brake protein YcgR